MSTRPKLHTAFTKGVKLGLRRPRQLQRKQTVRDELERTALDTRNWRIGWSTSGQKWVHFE